MLRHFFYILFIWLVAGATDVSAQIFTPRHPIYIVNGERMQEAEVKAIDPEDIVENKLLPADEETIAKRMDRASKEADVIEKYDYLVVNDRVEDCVEEVNRIITSRQAAVSNNTELIQELKEELLRVK